MGLLLVALAGVALAIAAARIDDGGNEASGQSGSDAEPAPAPGATSDAAGPADEVDDVGPCQMLDDETLQVEIVNNSSKQSSYIIDVNFLDASGQRVSDESFFVNHVRPGETAREDHFVFDSGGGATCEVAEVERFAAESPDDRSEVTCDIVGLDTFEDLDVELTATNGSSGLSDYFITVAFVRDGIRIGTGFGTIENVRPGQTAPGDAFTTTDGPVDAVACDVVHVERTASE